MLKPQKIVRSLRDFIEIVSELQGSGLELWFRGHGSAEWSLVPKLYRQRNKNTNRKMKDKQMREQDDEIREQFARMATNLSDIVPKNKWDWYFVMQHYGTRTRLLDWTENSLIALYFAVRHNQGYFDAAVWALDPWKLNRRVVGKKEVIPPGDPGTTTKDVRPYQRWLHARFAKGRWARWPVAIYPGHILRRIGAQRSCFTIHGRDRRGLEAISRELNIPLRKIVVPSWNVEPIKQSLDEFGIDEATVFPDLEGLSGAVNYWNDEPVEAKPHVGVYTRLGRSKVDRDGIGVFAISRIKRGTKLFHGDCEEMVWIDKNDLPRGPRQIRKLYDDFAIIKRDEKDKKTRYACPLNFNRLTVSWYLNSSRRPNVGCDKDYNFFALRDIERDEELTVDYSTYSEEP
ncbi:MAG TPA: FRG domain-containing protein [Thermodesulfobacteriota bacterium]|nr:FRG domain-containing protein [Thermodesulfobacteriota bacterium]